jgi:hypothetical protein
MKSLVSRRTRHPVRHGKTADLAQSVRHCVGYGHKLWHEGNSTALILLAIEDFYLPASYVARQGAL